MEQMNKDKISTSDKWKMFKNFMHNDLGITKGDIRTWMEEAAKEEGRNLVHQAFKEFDISKMIRQIVLEEKYWGNKQLTKEIKEMMAAELIKDIIMEIKKK